MGSPVHARGISPLLLMLAWGLLACAETLSPAVGTPARLDLEPQSYVPPPSPNGTSGRVSSLSVRGGTAEARQLALSMVNALLQGDRVGLEAAFSTDVHRLHNGRTTGQDELVTSCLKLAEPLGHRASARLGDVIDLEQVSVGPLKASSRAQAGMVDSDLMVTLPLRRSIGRSLLHSLARNPCLNPVYVRMSNRPRIIAVSR